MKTQVTYLLHGWLGGFVYITHIYLISLQFEVLLHFLPDHCLPNVPQTCQGTKSFRKQVETQTWSHNIKSTGDSTWPTQEQVTYRRLWGVSQSTIHVVHPENQNEPETSWTSPLLDNVFSAEAHRMSVEVNLQASHSCVSNSTGEEINIPRRRFQRRGKKEKKKSRSVCEIKSPLRPRWSQMSVWAECVACVSPAEGNRARRASKKKTFFRELQVSEGVSPPRIHL